MGILLGDLGGAQDEPAQIVRAGKSVAFADGNQPFDVVGLEHDERQEVGATRLVGAEAAGEEAYQPSPRWTAGKRSGKEADAMT